MTTLTQMREAAALLDHAPFINCLAAQGFEPYAKGKAKRKPKVVTT